MDSYKIKKAYKHDNATQIYRATLVDGSSIDVEATSIDDAKAKIDDHLKSITITDQEKEKEA